MLAASSIIRRYVLWIIPIGMLWYSISKGMIDVVQEWGKVNFYATYENGFMRRGLLGTVFDTLFGDKTEAEYLSLAVKQHTLVVWLLAALVIAGLIFAASRARRPLAVLVGGCVLASGQVWAHLSYVVGYLDPHVLLVVALATGAVALGRPTVGAAIAGVGPLFHEQFLFYWAPVAAAQAILIGGVSVKGESRAHQFPELKFILLLVPMMVTTALVMLLHSDDSARSAVFATPVAQDLRDGLMRQHFGQTTASAFGAMLGIWGRNLDSGLLAVAMYSGPAVLLSVLTVAAFPQIGNRRAMIAALVVGSFGCLSILLLAWDLSRFASMTTVMWAAVTVLIAARASRLDEADDVAEEVKQLAALTPVEAATAQSPAALSSGPTIGARVDTVLKPRKPQRTSSAVAWAAMAIGLAVSGIGVATPLVFSYFDIYFVLRGPHQPGPTPPLQPVIERFMEPYYPPKPA